MLHSVFTASYAGVSFKNMNPQDLIDEAELCKINNDLKQSISLWQKVINEYPETEQHKYATSQIQKYKSSIPNIIYSDDIFSFEGRINRKKFWLINSAIFVIGFFLVAGTYISGNISSVFNLLILLYAIPATWVFCAAFAKRLHDINSSGWWQLIFIIPLIGNIFFIYIGLIPSDETYNDYDKTRL